MTQVGLNFAYLDDSKTEFSNEADESRHRWLPTTTTHFAWTNQPDLERGLWGKGIGEDPDF